jgi:endonuclease/exonuclease/phosphatase family metal-dependent hydrolase
MSVVMIIPFRVFDNQSLSNIFVLQYCIFSFLGIGILSRYPIVSASKKVIRYQHGPDTNKRIIIHAKVRTDNSGILDVFVLHLSYVREQQCENVNVLLRLLGGMDTVTIINFLYPVYFIYYLFLE